jgi:anhydro-N-acetylmuramic acid kinase
MRALAAKLSSGQAVVAGVMSGTSGDGIDVALVRFAPPARPAGGLGPPRQLAFRTAPFEPGLGARVRAVLDGAPLDLRATALLSRDLGRAFGAAARSAARDAGLALDLVGSHGQTVWHHDGVEPSGPATLQLGDGDFVAEAAGCAVASDFRQRDVAAGGEGAPIAALADGLLFATLPRPAAILNLGGISNLTLLDAGDEPRSFDTGPAGALLDSLARRFQAAPYDEGGAFASGGRASEVLLDELSRHPFLRRAPPKSTGRDTFGEAWVDGVVRRARELGLGAQDLCATAADFVARCVTDALRAHAPAGSSHLVVCGGGAHHARVLRALAALSPVPVATGAEFGVDPDAREALAFAVLAARCVLDLPSSSPAATGAAPGRVLGKLSAAPPAATTAP